MRNSIKYCIISFFILSNLLYSTESYIVKFKKTDRLQQIQREKNIEFKAIFPELKQNIYKNKLQNLENEIIKFSNYYVIEDATAISKILSDPDIEFIEPNYIYHIEKINPPNDSLFSKQWALTSLNAEGVWQKATGKGIIIGIIDTGIDFTHPDLINQLSINPLEDINKNGTFEPWSVNEVRNGITGDLNGIDDDGNGYIDDVIGYDFVDENTAYFGDWADPDPIPEDEQGHGTSVAGVIAAEGNNNIGIIGLAYNSKILTARAFDIGGAGEADDIAQSIIYLAINGAKIINCSFGDYFKSQIVADAIKFAQSIGCVVVASSGNEGRIDPHFPSDYEGVISVGGSTEDGRVWNASNNGVNLSLIAPATNIATTDKNGNYRAITGTSFSAPYVSAAIALLLETDSSLKQNEILALLIASAQKLNPNGWDIKAGAGILDIANALNYIGKGAIEIIYPQQFEIIDKSKTKEIPIITNIVTPLFDSYQLQLSKFKSNTFEDTQISGNEAIINDTIGSLNLEQLADTTYYISLKINLKNGQFHRINKSVQIISNETPNRIVQLKTVPAYKNGKRIQIIAATTNYPSKFWIEVHKSDNPDIHYRVDQIINNSVAHYLELDNLIASGEYTGTAYATTSNEDTVKYNFYFNFNPSLFSQYNYSLKPYSLKRGYLFNSVNNYYNINQSSIIINDLSDFDIGKTEIYNFENNQFSLKDTNNSGWIPVKTGKSPISNSLALLSKNSGRSIMTMPPNNYGNPYAQVIFESEIGKTFWADNFFDIDGDGVNEIIAYNDTTYTIYKFINSTYQYYNSIPNPKLEKKFSISMGSVIGDFDGDGAIEIFIPDVYGRFAIYQYQNNNIQLEYLDTIPYNSFGSSPYVSSIDLDGTGNLSIIIGSVNSQNLFNSINSGSEPIWSFRLIKADGINSYKIEWEENFTGVRAGADRELGIFFRNGVVAGNLDNEPGEELCISTFPNFMVMKWDTHLSTFKPVWIYPYSFTNSAIIYDFDKNGINDIGIATVDSTRFFELGDFTSKPDKPTIIEAIATDENTILIKWVNVPSTEIYNIYQVIFQPDGSSAISQIAQTQLDSIVIDELSPQQYYYFLITSVDSSKKSMESDFSELIEIFTHNPIKPISINVLANNLIKLNFNGKLKPIQNDNSICNVLDFSSNSSIQPSSIQVANDTSFLLTFVNPLISGNYKMDIASFKDYYGTPTIAGLLDFEIIEQPIKEELYLTSLQVLSPTLILLYFSDFVEKLSAETPDNYSIKPFGRVVVASRNDPDSNAVMLRLSEDLRERDIIGLEYSITARNIFAIDLKKITDGPGNTLSFVLTRENLSTIYTFPNPVSFSNDDAISFGNLTSQAKITIMNLNGKELITINETDANGGVRWNLRDKSGNKLPVGIYLYKITGKNSDGIDVLWEMNKFAIVP